MFVAAAYQPLDLCLTRDTVPAMTSVTIRELRNRGGDVVDRVEAGERVLVTRDGKPVAELRPLTPSALSLSELLRRRRNLPALDPNALRRDIDEVIAPAL